MLFPFRFGYAHGLKTPDNAFQVLVRPPQGGYVVLTPQPEPELQAGLVWTGTYDLPSWYREGSYAFRFLAIDKARNSTSTEIVIRVPEVVVARGPSR